MRLYQINHSYKKSNVLSSFFESTGRDIDKERINKERILLLYITPKIEKPYFSPEFHDAKKKKKRSFQSRDPTLKDIVNELDVWKHLIEDSCSYSQNHNLLNNLLTGFIYFKNGKVDFVYEKRINLIFKLNDLSYAEVDKSFYGITDLIQKREISLSRESQNTYKYLKHSLSKHSEKDVYNFLINPEYAQQIFDELNQKHINQKYNLENKKHALNKQDFLSRNEFFRNLMSYIIVRNTFPPAKWPFSPIIEDNVLYFSSHPVSKETKLNQGVKGRAQIQKSHFALLIKTTLQELNNMKGNNNYKSKIMYSPKKQMSIIIK